jgi:Uma2 family endonuclease
MATAVLVPLSEYLSTTYHPDCEWIDGELKARPVGENAHATIQTFLIRYLEKFEEQFGVRATQELRVQVTMRNFRVPDVLVLEAAAPYEDIITVPPLLCIEVLSPEDRLIDLQEKIDDYLNMGVQAIWIINPRLRKTFQVLSGGIMPLDTLTVPATPIFVTAAEIFAYLDRIQQSSKSGKP